MIRRALTALLPLMALFLSAQREPILVPEISEHEVQVRQGFTGTELLLYGAILDPRGARAGSNYDIVVVLKGPTTSIRVREKERIGGIWINADSTDFRSAPSYFAVASSAPIADIVDEKTAAIYELGTRYIQFSPSGTIDPEEQARFSQGLVEMLSESSLYQQDEAGVTISEDVLYQARISLPSNVQTGVYTAETFAITDGQVVASAITEVAVRKVGLEKRVEQYSQDYSFAYGIAAVLLSIFMGWAAGRLFALV